MSILRYLFFLTPFFLVGQSISKIKNDFILFEEAATGEPILVYNDSMAARGFDFKEHFKISFPDGLRSADFNNYQYQIGDATYLVSNGCGVVLQFEDNSFKRIDRSFRHKNQFDAVPFVKDSTLYLYGGYGLFTFKNILTKFSFEAQEWYSAKMINKEMVPPSASNLYWQKGDSLYVFAGRVEDPTDVLDSKFAPKSVWQLNLETLEWENIGEHAVDNYFSIFESPLQFHTEDKLVFLNKDINEVDIINNKVTRYKIDNFKSLIKIIYHKGSGNVSYVYSTTNEEIFVASEPYENFKGELIKTIPFFKASIPKTRLFLIFICVGILLLLIYLAYYKRLKTVNSKEEVILYDAKNDTFSYNNKTIKTLGQFKKQLLIGFMEYGERYILLNELNDLLNKYGDKNENHTALQKRRETLLKQLKNDLALVLNISEDKVFSVRKYKYDRRLKEIKLEIKIIKK